MIRNNLKKSIKSLENLFRKKMAMFKYMTDQVVTVYMT